MKLDKELKDRIDRYFDNISATELYTILTRKYNFPEKDSSIIVINDEYICKENIIPELIKGNISYADIIVKQDVEIAKMKLLENTSDFQDGESVYNPTCTLPLAA